MMTSISTVDFLWALLALLGLKFAPLLATWAETNKGRSRIARFVGALAVAGAMVGAGVRDVELIAGAVLASLELPIAAYLGIWKDSKVIENAERVTARLKPAPAHGDI